MFSYCTFVSSVVVLLVFLSVFFFFKQKTAYEMRISDWSSDVCSSDLDGPGGRRGRSRAPRRRRGRVGSSGPAGGPAHADAPGDEIGRASCRERVCQYV